jgi:hypothetical protein
VFKPQSSPPQGGGVKADGGTSGDLGQLDFSPTVVQERKWWDWCTLVTVKPHQ